MPKPSLPKGGGVALDLLIEQAEEWTQRNQAGTGEKPDEFVLVEQRPAGNFVIHAPASPTGLRVKIKWWGSHNRWSPSCNCSQFKIHRNCRHIAPAARTLRGSTSAEVRDGLVKPASTFADEIVARAGRKLTPAEWKMVDGLHRCHHSHTVLGMSSFWDLARCGWLPYHATLGDNTFPADRNLNIRDYWLCIAMACRQRNIDIPDFMLPMSDPSEASPVVREFTLAKERQAWLAQLDTPNLSKGARDAFPSAEYRLLIGAKQATLQCRADPEADFKSLKGTDARRLAHGDPVGELPHLSPEGLLALRLMQSDSFGGKVQLYFDSTADLERLNQLVSLPFMRERMVGTDETPLLHHPGKLTWHLVHPADGMDEYRLELRHSSGEAFSQKINAILPGPPPLYLAEDGFHAGPSRLPEMYNGVVRVPRQVMESKVGLRLCMRAGVETPSTVKARVNILKPTVEVKIWMGPDTRYMRGGETCWVRATATYPGQEGLVENLEYYGWNPTSHTSGRSIIDDFTEMDNRSLQATREWILDGGFVFEKSRREWRRGSMPLSFPQKFREWIDRKPPTVHVILEGDLESLTKGDITERLRVVVSASDHPDWFNLQVARDISDNTLSPEELALLREADGGWVRMQKGGWRRLVTEGGDVAGEALARLGLDDMETGLVRAHALQLSGAARGLLSAEDAEQVRRKASEVRMRVTPGLPAGFKAELRPYQLDGFHFLCYLSENSFGGVLADDMGLGKTVQTLVWLLYLREKAGKKAGPSLVVCPKSVVENWQSEAKRFAPKLRVQCWTGDRLDDFATEAGTADLHVVNYAQIRMLEGRWPSGPFLAVVLDEAQAAKNPDSDTARAARGIKARHRLALTGTPIENRLLDLWSILQFAMPGALGGRADFTRRFNAKTDPHARLRLSARVRPFLLRRTKAQVATDLPERVEKDLLCAMEGEQRTLYQAELKAARAILLNLKSSQELDRERFHILTSMLRLRQICCSPRLVNASATEEGAKLETLRDSLESLVSEGQKVLVFSQFTGMLDLIAEMADRDFPEVQRFRLDGSTEDRGPLVASFQQSEGAAIFLLSLKAGGTGLNLTAASNVILYDPWWNPAVEAQAIDRTHRIGQQNQVMAYRLIAKDSIEEKIRQLQNSKKSLAADVLGEEAFAKTLTLDDLKYLFE